MILEKKKKKKRVNEGQNNGNHHCSSECSSFLIVMVHDRKRVERSRGAEECSHLATCFPSEAQEHKHRVMSFHEGNYTDALEK